MIHYLTMRKLFPKLLSITILFMIVVAIGFIPVKPRNEIKEKIPQETAKEKPLLKGFSITPKSFESKDFLDFFERIRTSSNLVLWAGDVKELANEKSVANSLATISKNYGFTPVIIVEWVDKKLILDFVSKVKPPYLGIGNEINRESSSYIQKLAKDFSEIYPEIKNASPETKVFPIFQLELMKGLRGGLFGGINDESKNQWKLLDQFPKADLIAFTTYPALIYKAPSEIPNDYYSVILTYTEKPVLFTEVGWSSKIDNPSWETSESEQAEFIKIFEERVNEPEPEFAIWTFMYDQNVQKPFDTMGLISRDGKEKEGWKVWTEE